MSNITPGYTATVTKTRFSSFPFCKIRNQISALMLACLFFPVAEADTDVLTLASSETAKSRFQYNYKDLMLSSKVNEILYHDLDLEKQLISFLKSYPDGKDIQTPMLQYRVGMLFKNGQGMEKNISKAVQWLQKSADKDYAAAQYELGMMHKSGNGVSKDLAKAREWFNRAHRNGYAVSADVLTNDESL